MACIYTITNLVNNKMYIGCASNPKRRWWEHSSMLKRGKHPNDFLQRAWNKYAEKNFMFEILEECSVSIMLALEHYWVITLNTNNDKYGYNLKITHPEGKTIQSLETRRKISINKKGKKRTDNAWIGRTHKLESKEKMRLAKLGRKRTPHSILTREKISVANKGKKHSNPKKGIACVQFSLSNMFIKEWKSQTEAAKSLGLSQGNIGSCLKGTRKSAGGFVFKYNNKEVSIG